MPRTLYTGPVGQIAREFAISQNLPVEARRLPLQVLRSGAGFYLGTADESGPVSRESAEYWPTASLAQAALDAGPDAWTQRDHP